MNITISQSAEKFIRRMIRFNGGSDGSGFRLVVTTGGCSGLSSEFSVESAPLAGDGVLEYNGIKLFLPAESRLLLDGVTIDFADTLMNSGLTFIDPKAKGCGTCGSSGPTVSSVDIGHIGHKH